MIKKGEYIDFENQPSLFKKEVRLNLSEADMESIEEAFAVDLTPRLEMIWKRLESEFNRKKDYRKREYFP